MYVFARELQISLEIFGYMLELGCSGFGRGNPPTDPQKSGFVGGNLPPTVEVVGLGGFRFEFRQVAQVSRVPGLVGQSYP